eukprot:Amastigsp_a677007_5.p1 type:complete len:257 gc:universal Amastigsp_a677007_5:810-40(-)
MGVTFVAVPAVQGRTVDVRAGVRSTVSIWAVWDLLAGCEVRQSVRLLVFPERMMPTWRKRLHELLSGVAPQPLPALLPTPPVPASVVLRSYVTELRRLAWSTWVTVGVEGLLPVAYQAPSEQELQWTFGALICDTSEDSNHLRTVVEWAATYLPVPQLTRCPLCGTTPCKVLEVNHNGRIIISPLLVLADIAGVFHSVLRQYQGGRAQRFHVYRNIHSARRSGAARHRLDSCIETAVRALYPSQIPEMPVGFMERR